MAEKESKEEELPSFGIRQPRESPTPEFLSRLIDSGRKPEIWGLVPGRVFPGKFKPVWALSLVCFRSHNGHRIFLPYLPTDKTVTRSKADIRLAKQSAWEHLVRVAGAVGLEARSRLPEVTPENGHQHAVMLTIHEYARRMKEFYSRLFRLRDDLIVKDRPQDRVLPQGLGPGQSIASRVRDEDRLINDGREEILRGGTIDEKKDTKLFVSAGLYVAATKASGRAPRTKGKRLAAIRAAMYAEIASDAPRLQLGKKLRDKAYAQYEERYRNRVNERRDETTEAFRVWHSGGHSNVPQGIVNELQKAGEATKQEARWALVELSWASFAYAARVVAAVMRLWLDHARREALRMGSPLTEVEQNLFNLLYFGVPETGGIPLVVLHDRLDLLEPWIVANFNGTCQQPRWDVFYTLLNFYSYMAAKRRDLDKERKRWKRGREAKPKADFKTQSHGVGGSNGDRIRKQHGIVCECKNPVWATKTVAVKQSYSVTFECELCRKSGLCIVSKSELAALAKNVGNE